MRNATTKTDIQKLQTTLNKALRLALNNRQYLPTLMLFKIHTGTERRTDNIKLYKEAHREFLQM